VRRLASDCLTLSVGLWGNIPIVLAPGPAGHLGKVRATSRVIRGGILRPVAVPIG